MRRDLQRRLPYYISDYTDGWNYRVIPATGIVFFSSVLPALAFSLDLIEKTGEQGVTEVLLASFVSCSFCSARVSVKMPWWIQEPIAWSWPGSKVDRSGTEEQGGIGETDSR